MDTAFGPAISMELDGLREIELSTSSLQIGF
jgi:hypothetical protein